jgi:hypothetical protein
VVRTEEGIGACLGLFASFNKETTTMSETNAADHLSKVIPLKDWGELYWAYNLPLQIWRQDDGTWHIPANYMARKQRCASLDNHVSDADRPQFCRNAAAILRNLADLFDAAADGQLDHIYYPDKPVAEAIAETAEKRAEADSSTPSPSVD